MARKKKVSAGTILVVGVVGFAAVVAIDHYVLKGKLGIAGRINMLLGKLKGKEPITPSVPAPEAAENLGGTAPEAEFEGSPEEAALLQRQEQLAAEEPETATLARLRRARRANRIRIGGLGP